MKRITLLVALAVIFALAAPVMAGPYSDVPASHWAYDALNKLSATGIITGYPDGTYKGNQNLTRYQIAVLVGRVLDAVEAETELLNDQIEAVENGLTAGQAEDVIAIFKSLLAKYMPEQELPEGLTAMQAEEVAGIVEALSLEFKFELEAMGKDIDGLLERMEAAEVRIADLEGRADALEVITWNGSYGFDLYRTAAWGNTAFIDPFMMDLDDDGANDTYSVPVDTFEQTVELGVNITTENLTASLDILGKTDNFVGVVGGVDLTDFTATITGDDFTAIVGDDQEVNIAPYVFAYTAADRDYDGVKVTVGDKDFALIRNGAADVFATSADLGIYDATVNFGMVDLVNSDEFVVGVSTPADAFGFDLTTDIAIQNPAGKIAPYVALNAKKSLGIVDIEGNYGYVNSSFTGIEADLVDDGMDVRADATLLDGKLTTNARYSSYTENLLGFGGEYTLDLGTAYFDMEMGDDSASNAINRTQFGADITTDVMFMNIAAGYNYDEYTDSPVSPIYVDSNGALPLLNRVYADVTADLPVEGLTGTANYVFGLGNDVAGTGLTTHEYNIEYAQDIFTAGFNMGLVGSAAADVYLDAEYSIFTAGISRDLIGGSSMSIYATADPEAKEFKGIEVDTVAGFKMASGAATAYNYNFGLDLTKQVNDKTAVSYGYVYDNRGINDGDANSMEGLKIEQTASLAYDITSELKASLDYTNLYFDGAAGEDYGVQELTTGISFNF